MAETFNDSSHQNATRFIKQRVADIEPTLDADEEESAPRERKRKIKPAVLTSVVAGGVAGVVVDISLYPLDTIKTRLQSKHGFRASGGFRGIYKGVVPILLASAPTSALFFATYNTLVNTLRSEDSYKNPFVYLVAGSTAEIIGSSLRLPLEIIKQRNQISRTSSSLYIIRRTYREEGIPGFYRGFWSTLLREIPFAAIQYPLWEYMLNQFIIHQHGKELTALQSAVCGAAAGAIAGAVTTPMDVIKTRVMLEEKRNLDRLKNHLNYQIAKEVYRDRGILGLFAGVVPRVLWITLGGFIYFGAYEKTKLLCERNWNKLTFWKPVTEVHEGSPTYHEKDPKTSTFFDNNKEYIEENNAVDEHEQKKEEIDFDRGTGPFEDGPEINRENQKIIDTTLLPPVS